MTTEDTPIITSTTAEASTSAPPDPRAIMAALGVSCATCRHWETSGFTAPSAGQCCGIPEGAHDATWVVASAASFDGLLTRADHFCAMWERRT